MARYHGKAGKLVVGASGDVAEVTDWTMDIDAPVVDASYLGVASRNGVQGQYGGMISVTVNYDPADADGQETLHASLMAATTLDFKLYELSDGDTMLYWSGAAFIAKAGEKGSVGGKVSRDYSLTFEGDVSRLVVGA